MRKSVTRTWQCTIVLLGIVCAAFPVIAEEDEPAILGARWDISLDLVSWPGLEDLEPLSGGSFRSMGFGFSGGVHFPVAQFANSELLLGADMAFAATDSGINGVFAQLFARQFFLGVSGKWLFGEQRNFSLDGGVGYHEVDITELDTEWWGSREIQYWSSSKASTWLGATWDIGAGREDATSGFSLGFRAYYADFGRVYSQDVRYLFPLGPDAGQLEGPIYMLRIGYSGR